jgi:hypothetical protein
VLPGHELDETAFPLTGLANLRPDRQGVGAEALQHAAARRRTYAAMRNDPATAARLNRGVNLATAANRPSPQVFPTRPAI